MLSYQKIVKRCVRLAIFSDMLCPLFAHKDSATLAQFGIHFRRVYLDENLSGTVSGIVLRCYNVSFGVRCGCDKQCD